ncbi:MAG: DNA polymerase III subunit delta [Clostridia bacterium]|nr:DNA polymerase III subunit delta [Clostridia bacterium]
MKFAQLKSKLENNFFPVIVLAGEDLYLLSKGIEFIRQSLKIAFEEMNIHYFGSDANLDDILIACRTMPLCSDKKLVVVEQYTPPKQLANEPKLINKMTAYIKNPSTDCCLVFITSKVNDFFNLDGIITVDCNRLEKIVIIKWIMTKCRIESVDIDKQSAGLIADYCLADMSRISKEVEKLVALKQSITQELVEQLVYQDIEYTAFDLANCVCLKNSKRALLLLDKMLSDKEKPREVFVRLYGTYRRMFYSLISKQTNAELASQLNVKEYAVVKAKESARRYTPVQLRKALDLFYRVDKSRYSVMITDDDVKQVVLELLNI